jgi:hypothetical protein
LDTAAEYHQVSERIAALERVSADADTFWSDAHLRKAVVWLQDRAHHIEEAVEGCRRALATMFLVMLLRNPFLENFCQLLDTLVPMIVSIA